MKQKTRATQELLDAKATFYGWYGKDEKPKEITVEIETKEHFKTTVDIAFGKENETENHFDTVQSWEELEQRTFKFAKLTFGYRIVGVYEVEPSRPIVYHP